MRATPPTCGRSFTFGIPQELRRPVGLYGPPPSVAGVTVSALLKCCANQVSCAGHSPPKRNSVAGVALSALLRSCANQVAYAGPPPKSGKPRTVVTPQGLRRSICRCSSNARIPAGLRRSGCLCGPPSKSVAGVAFSALLGSAQIRWPMRATTQSVAAVALSTLLRSCETEVVCAGHTPPHTHTHDKKRECGTRGSFSTIGAAPGRWPMNARPKVWQEFHFRHS